MALIPLLFLLLLCSDRCMHTHAIYLIGRRWRERPDCSRAGGHFPNKWKRGKEEEEDEELLAGTHKTQCTYIGRIRLVGRGGIA